MDFFKKADITPTKALKVAGIVVLAIIALSIVLGLVGASLRPFSRGGSEGSVASDGNVMFYSKESAPSRSLVMGLSTRNALPIVPPYGGTIGDTAEAFEVTNYSASIETRNVEATCGSVLDLKAKAYVIFENSSAYDQGCSYTFKVKKGNVAEILAFIDSLDPKQLSENTQTIKNQVDDFTSQADILKKKLASIDETLKSALSAYNEITALATKSQNADALAKIIDSKIGIIERMTQARIEVSTQLDYLSRAKADQLDRLEYTYFNVNVYENKFIDGDNIKDSWKQAVRQFFTDVNRIIQEVTLGLVTLLLVAVQFILYIFIIVFIAKYVWKAVKKVWKK
jgi:hypothetical protein